MTPTITWLEKVRKLPEAQRAEVDLAAHKIAMDKMLATSGMHHILDFYDEDTWRQAYELAAAKRGDR